VDLKYRGMVEGEMKDLSWPWLVSGGATLEEEGKMDDPRIGGFVEEIKGGLDEG
jgi:hypothetical protein